ncbi:MAG: flagellar FliL protein [Chloroflexota bacterium]|jgi:flagellar FliL protein
MTKKEAKPAAPAAEGEGEAPPKKRNLLLIIGGAVGGLVFLGMAAVIVILLLRPAAAAPAAAAPAEAGAVDENGNPVEAPAAAVDENGNPVEAPAAAVDENGNPVEAAVDENGNPIAAAAAAPKIDMNSPPVPPALPVPGEGVLFDVGTKVINLADPGGRRYLKVGIVLEFAPHDTAWYSMANEQRAELQALFETEMGSKQPVIEDLVISIISSKSFEQVYTLEGKEGLRQEIINRINQLLPTQLVMYVYFNEFVVQ